VEEPIGTTFGEWTVVGYEKRWKNATAKKEGWWKTDLVCRCSCGTEQTITKDNLRRGLTTRCRACSKPNLKHGESKHKLHAVWQAIKQRCNNPNNCNYSNYGGRGIKMHGSWHEASNFIQWAINNGWEEGLQIDRIDNDKDYEPSNCRFVTQDVNERNKRVKITSETGFLGVSVIRNKNSTKYKSSVTIASTTFRLGHYSSPEEAAKVRDDFVVACGIPLHLNFPNELFDRSKAESEFDADKCLRLAADERQRIRNLRPESEVRLNRPTIHMRRS